LLASLSIVFDKPFVIGDLIYVGNEKGTVEHIGIKTTRVRSLSGEELIFSNKDLLESRIQNFKRMSERRGVLNIGVTYSTPADKLEMIPIWIRAIVENINNLRFERCHFSNYGNSSLDFEIVFWVMDPEFQIYMDLKQALLIGIFKKFQLENIEFAYPTQTLIVEKFPQPSSGGN
jgi:small-conductance mechanosensitive channel